VPKPGRPITLPGPLGDLARKVGGVGVLARQIGVDPRTVRAWATGRQTPSITAQNLINILTITNGCSHE
jgi:hypothetical protein